MKSSMLALCATAIAAAWPLAAAGQHPHHHHRSGAADPSATAAFAEAARAATARYHDRAAAIADGFRRLGPDFPGMGEHWIHPGRMVSGTLDVDRPQGLSYAVIGGRPVLLGVIYARPLGAGEPVPDFPFPDLPWHDHTGAIDEESVLLNHVPSEGSTGAGVRLGMLHAWVWLANPDGVFAADNWSLPFVRLGLPVPAAAPSDAARALSLLVGGDEYYGVLYAALGDPTPAEASAARLLIGRSRMELEEWLAQNGATGELLDDSKLAALVRRWTALWSELAAHMRPAAAARMLPLLIPTPPDERSTP